VPAGGENLRGRSATGVQNHRHIGLAEPLKDGCAEAVGQIGVHNGTRGPLGAKVVQRERSAWKRPDNRAAPIAHMFSQVDRDERLVFYDQDFCCKHSQITNYRDGETTRRLFDRFHGFAKPCGELVVLVDLTCPRTIGNARTNTVFPVCYSLDQA